MNTPNRKEHDLLPVWSAAKGSALMVAAGLALVLISIAIGGWTYENWTGIVGVAENVVQACIGVATLGRTSFWSAACGGLMAIAVLSWGLCVNHQAGEHVPGWLKAAGAVLCVLAWLVCAVGATQMTALSVSSAYQVIAMAALWLPAVLFVLFLGGLLLDAALTARLP